MLYYYLPILKRGQSTSWSSFDHFRVTLGTSFVFLAIAGNLIISCVPSQQIATIKYNLSCFNDIGAVHNQCNLKAIRVFPPSFFPDLWTDSYILFVDGFIQYTFCIFSFSWRSKITCLRKPWHASNNQSQY